MADRVLVFSSDPGRVRAEIPITLPRPRDTESAAFRQIVDEVYGLMTSHGRQAAGVEQLTIGYRLPDTTPGKLVEMLETIADQPFDGRADLPALAEVTELPDDTLFHIYDGLRVLGFARLAEGDIFLTPGGRALVEAENDHRKAIFADHLLQTIPLATHIKRVLDDRPKHRAPEDRFLQELQDYLTGDEAERVLEVMVDWGRYAEIFDYDYNSGMLHLPEDDEDEDGSDSDPDNLLDEERAAS
jgi:NitT/TauT family transport system ATP-binding protein